MNDDKPNMPPPPMIRELPVMWYHPRGTVGSMKPKPERVAVIGTVNKHAFCVPDEPKDDNWDSGYCYVHLLPLSRLTWREDDEPKEER